MIITLKTLQQKSFKVEIDESQTIATLKLKIEEQQGSAFPAGATRLIYSGKILSDASIIGEYKIQENGFVVVMVNKAKSVSVPKQAAATSSTSVSTPTPSQPTTDTPQETSSSSGTAQLQAAADTGSTSPTPTPVSTPSAVVTTATTSPPAAAEEQSSSSSSVSEAARESESGLQRGGDEAAHSAMMTEEQYDSAVADLMDLGYQHDAVIRAMRASFNNPDRAADFLLSGNIPDQSVPPEPAQVLGAGALPQQPPQQPPQQQQQPLQAVSPTAPAAAGGADLNPLEALRRIPTFNQLRQQLQQNPNMLQGLLRQIGQTNPQLLALISQNQDAFVQMLNEDPNTQGPAPSQGEAEGQERGASGVGTPVSIQVTPDEKLAIDRLKAMGFPEHLVIQAYFACEKNEDNTIEFLLNQDPNDD